jgi:cell division protein FtsN
MARNQDGEFEVLLGNKQLLSIFFIVVILLGVFFTMGYVLGRNAASPDTATAAARPTSEAQRTPAGSVSAFPDEPIPTPAPPPSEAAPAVAERQPGPPAAAQPKRTVPPPLAELEPVSGKTYLQVAAVKRPEAEVVADVLKKKGFPSMISPHPTEPVFRVLVGPVADADAIARMREGLEAAGFKSLVRKY